MAKYKISVSKTNKKYIFILEAWNENEAKSRVHKEGYSILSVEEVKNNELLWKKYYFISTFRWREKKWQVIWRDIFKVFLKLKWLWYEISELYEELDKNLSLTEKNKILKNLEEQYNIFKNTGSKKKVIIEKKEDNLWEANLKNFYLKKSLDENYHLIDLVLKKLKNILNKNIDYDLTPEKEKKLRDISNNLLKLKKITNITKLKTIWELALLKIWQLELDKLEKTKDIKTKILLKETNKLLKQTWSNKHFIEREKDIKVILKKLYKKIFSKNKKSIKRKEEIDKKSYSYMKNLLLLQKYKNKLSKNNLWIIKQISLLFINRQKYELSILKRKVIKQNIAILTARKEWKVSSYTKIIRSTKSIIEKIILLFHNINEHILIIVIIYMIYFIFTINLSLGSINYKWMHFFILLFVLHYTLTLSRNIYLLILNFVIFYFVILFWSINF